MAGALRFGLAGYLAYFTLCTGVHENHLFVAVLLSLAWQQPDWSPLAVFDSTRDTTGSISVISAHKPGGAIHAASECHAKGPSVGFGQDVSIEYASTQHPPHLSPPLDPGHADTRPEIVGAESELFHVFAFLSGIAAPAARHLQMDEARSRDVLYVAQLLDTMGEL